MKKECEKILKKFFKELRIAKKKQKDTNKKSEEIGEE